MVCSDKNGFRGVVGARVAVAGECRHTSNTTRSMLKAQNSNALTRAPSGVMSLRSTPMNSSETPACQNLAGITTVSARSED